MDDKHIVAQARRGELSAFEELVTRYEKRVYAIALRSSGSPEDAFNTNTFSGRMF